MKAEIKKIEWDDLANQAFEQIKMDVVDVDFFKALELEQGAALYGCFVDDLRVGSVLVRYEDYPAGSEMVLVLAGQNEQGRNRCPLFFPLFEDLARLKGCSWVRGHTDRKGMMFEVAKLGYGMSEIIYRKTL